MKEKKEKEVNFEDITNKVINAVLRILNVNGIKVKTIVNEQFQGYLGMDSLQVVELFMECEETFGITFTDEEILKIDTPAKLISRINEKLTDSTR